jgi:hypothetical protein
MSSFPFNREAVQAVLFFYNGRIWVSKLKYVPASKSRGIVIGSRNQIEERHS